MCVYICICIFTIREIEAMNFKESKMGTRENLEGEKGRGKCNYISNYNLKKFKKYAKTTDSIYIGTASLKHIYLWKFHYL